MGKQPADAFLAPPPRPLPLPSSPHRSLMSSWLTGVDRENKRPDSRNSIEIQTQTYRAPLESFEKTRQANGSPHQQQQQQKQRGAAAGEADLAAGLLCLERSIPDEILLGLARLVNNTAPFKAQVLRTGGARGVDNHAAAADEGWLDTLTAEFNTPCCSGCPANTEGESDLDRQDDLSPDAESQEQRLLGNSGSKRATTPSSTQQPKNSANSDQNLDLIQQQQQQRQLLLETESQESVSWLKADIKRVANLFAREVPVVSGATMLSSGEGSPAVGAAGKQQAKEEGGGGAADVTVKLELVEKIKCPRFHIDKVPIRLVCAYVGPSTLWLDGYDKREMENNRRRPTPMYNLKISEGRQARHARTGDVLIFRGEPEGASPVEGGALGVIHRSPDMVEGRKRLVLTIDAGDITATPFVPAFS